MARVLVVDDSATMRSFLAAALEDVSPGIDVSEASSAMEALRRLPREPVDVVVTDVNMPDVNGLELIAFLRHSATLREVGIVVVSSEGSRADCDRAMRLGADAYLVKPFDPAALCEIVGDLVRRRAVESSR